MDMDENTSKVKASRKERRVLERKVVENKNVKTKAERMEDTKEDSSCVILGTGLGIARIVPVDEQIRCPMMMINGMWKITIMRDHHNNHKMHLLPHHNMRMTKVRMFEESRECSNNLNILSNDFSKGLTHHHHLLHSNQQHTEAVLVAHHSVDQLCTAFLIWIYRVNQAPQAQSGS